MEQGAGEERVGIDLDGRAILGSRKPEPFIQSLLGQAVFAAEFLHPGKMKEKLVHFLHAHQAESKFSRTLKVEDCLRRGESLYSQYCGSHHRAEYELVGLAFRCFRLLL